ncbi:MAG TPA: hypothetical protein VME40_12285, partial [Caulobacteraceae bacterium]|nr:hypothetical protein [Caulobacteraceae bacterium]
PLPPAVQAVVDCRKLADPQARLACYDTSVAAMETAETNGDVVSLDRAQRREVRRQAFGFALPGLSVFERGDKTDEMSHIDEVLASARQDAEGKWTFWMQDGQVWRQIDDEFLSRKPHAGSNIRIWRAMMGSYMLSVDGQPGVRAHRDE